MKTQRRAGFVATLMAPFALAASLFAAGCNDEVDTPEGPATSADVAEAVGAADGDDATPAASDEGREGAHEGHGRAACTGPECLDALSDIHPDGCNCTRCIGGIESD